MSERPGLRWARAGGALLLFLLVPLASAAPASVTMAQEDAVWNGAFVVVADGAGPVDLWLPATARVHAVLVDGAPAPWRAAGADRIRVDATAAGARVEVSFDVADQRPTLVRVVAPPGVDRLDVELRPSGGWTVQSRDAAFARGEDGVYRASVPVAPGDAIAVQVVAEGRVDEIPLLATIGGFALLGFLGVLAWHRARPPLAGRAPTRFVDHLVELQARLVPPVVLFGLLNVVYFTIGLRVVHVGGYPLVAPTWGADATIAARAFDAVAERLVPAGVQLVVLRPADAVVAQVGMCLFLAFVTVLPILTYEIAAFVGPGLEARERRVALQSLPLVTALFLAGALLGFLVMAPFMLRTLYEYAPTLGAAPLLSVGDLVGFSLLVMLTLGLAFELPVAMFALARLGVVRAATFGRYVRHAIVAMVLLAGIVTPDPSVISQLLLAGPLVGLYLAGIGAAAVAERRSKSSA